ncbi:MAG TPA: glycosyltransferase family 39 protein [Anaerolineae bacterium]|nr:glycosyltransferase family 39 protein [Anaerolineae bacterium]
MDHPVTARQARWGLPAILILYLALGSLYAIYTPKWQAPDEPAHYNYVTFLAKQHRFPILKIGDYPASYLEEVKAARFPGGMGVEPIRYEFHQPPLYYLLAVPAFWLGGGALLPLRLVSLAIGAALLLIVYWTVGEVAPGRPLVALGATAFVAFLPMHLAMTAAVNNDSLAELLLALGLLLTIRYLRDARVAGDRADRARERRLLVLLGITTGMAFLTKTSDYVIPLVVLTAIAVRHLWLEADPPCWRGTLLSVACYLVPAAALGMPWWLRNVAQYGFPDLLGLGRHNEVVAGQLRTAEFVAQQGAARLLHDFAVTTFHSFWGQFGWMGVLLDQRLYQALAILSTMAVAGFLLWLARAWSRRAAAPSWQIAAGVILALSGLLTLATYVWYNTGFLQHQGRYLFPALLPVGLGVALGWREALRRDRALWMAAAALAAALGIEVFRGLPTWTLAMLVGLAALLAVRRFLPPKWDAAIQACPYFLLLPVDLACLFLFIVPQLGPR